MRCLLVVFLCFSLTSASYLSWLYHLMGFISPEATDALSLVVGYTLQAVGIGLFAAIARRNPRFVSRPVVIGVLVLYALCMVPAIIGTSTAGVITFGLLMNLLCGLVAGLYLHMVASEVPANRRGIVFGGGYALATIAVWLLSMADGANFLRSGASIAVYIVLGIIVAVMFLKQESTGKPLPVQVDVPAEASTDAAQATASSFNPASASNPADVRSFLFLACATIVMLSLVKNLGFGFPSTDVQGGLSLELSRVFYALGLVGAGLLNDWNRKYGALFCLAALVVPFIMLALAGEPVSSMVFWCLDYFFFGFFSVFRVVLFCDMASDSGRLWLSGLGLAFGRIGDALGTGIFLLISSPALLVSLTAALFAVSVFLFFRLYQQLYMQPKPVEPERNRRDLFEEFASQYQLSSREREVLRLLIAERSNSEIAGEMFVSESTVKFHVHNLLKKTGCKNRLELLALFATK